MAQKLPPVKKTRQAPRSLRLHYRNTALSAIYDQLWMWTWKAWPTERELPAAGVDAFGAIFEIPAEDLQIQGQDPLMLGFRFKDRSGLDGARWFEMDRAWRPRDGWEVWIREGSQTLHRSAADALRPHIRAALVDALDRVEVHFAAPTGDQADPSRYDVLPGARVTQAEALSDRAVSLTVTHLDLSRDHTLRFRGATGAAEVGLHPRRVLDTFTSDAPLGVQVEDGVTTFRVWAPRARAVTLRLCADGRTPPRREVPLRREEAGQWAVHLPGDLRGLYYEYLVDGPRGPGEGFDPRRPINDPYALVALPSHDGHAGRGLVLAPSHLSPPRPIRRRPLTDLVIYEVHVRDLCGGPGSGFAPHDASRHQYLAWTRAGTRGPEGVTTGLDHLVELGINAVQLLPIQEYPWPRGRFNWGYFTANFFSPAALYASDPHGEARVHELRALVDALHARGIAVILDVVFNHTAEGDHEGPAFNLRGLDSKHWYRQDPADFRFFNGSGVGNELASERPMARRLIVDCCRFWVERYGIDGFRFDLAALLDLETLEALDRELPEGVALYGEPWSAGRAFWGRGSLNALGRWAVFNDAYRDALKGSPEGPDGGFVQGVGDLAAVKTAISGNTRDCGRDQAWATSPADGIQYVTCHDNLTLHDKLYASIPDLTEAEAAARIRLTSVLQLTSLGPILLHGGEELLRTKPYAAGHDGRPVRARGGGPLFDANSYRAPDRVNNLDWTRKARHPEVSALLAGLIRLRLSPAGRCLRRDSRPGPEALVFHEAQGTPHALGYTHNGDRSAGLGRIRVLVNPDRDHAATFLLEFDGDGWLLVCDGLEVDARGLAPPVTGPLHVKVPPLSAAIYLDAEAAFLFERAPGGVTQP